MAVTRRDLNLLLPMLAGCAALAQSRQDKKILPSASFKFEDLPVKVSGENRTRAVLNGATHKGSAVELHLTELGPGWRRIRRIGTRTKRWCWFSMVNWKSRSAATQPV